MKSYTLHAIQEVFSQYQDQCIEIRQTAETKEEYEEKQGIAYNKLLLDLGVLKNSYPEIFQSVFSSVNREEIIQLLERIKSNASSRYSIPFLPLEDLLVDVTEIQSVKTPSFVPLFNNDDSLSSIIVLPTDNQGKAEELVLNSIILSAILFLPINKVKIKFVDLTGTMLGRFFYQNIHEKLYDVKPISNESDLSAWLQRKNEYTLDVIKNYGSVSQYNINNKSIEIPYEIVVFCDPFDTYKPVSNQLNTYLQNSKRIGSTPIFAQLPFSGIEVLGTSQKSQLMKLIREFCGLGIVEAKDFVDSLPNKLPPVKDNKTELGLLTELKRNNVKFKDHSSDAEAGINLKNVIELPSLPKSSVFTNKEALDILLQYINSEADKKEEARIITQDISSLSTAAYENPGDALVIPVGESGKNVVNFRMDLVSHVHSFIIGQSGSGKSVFLHNVIGSAIMKYAPEDLELYLLDFKLGGVEFNRYQGVKHVKAMLVDNSDQQITLEILRELRERMAERGKLLRNAGASNLSEYNKMHPDSKLPHVLLVADECHEMFKQDSSIPRNISNAISDIVIKIAKEGRSQGVHLILATQTLSGTEISNEILNNVSDHYLLKCAAVDSERMVSGSADITSELTTGQIYYHHVEEQSRFQAFFTSKEDAAKLIDLVKKKAESHQSNGEFYFNGAQLFHQQNDVFGENINKLAKAPVAYVGKTIDINQCDLAITLRKDFSENLLLIGLNDSEQLTRTTMNAMISLMAATKRAGKDMNFKVFNCLQNEDSIYATLLDKLESKGYCELIDGRKERAVVLKNLVDDIQNETAKDTMLFILGQDKFRELKMDAELESAKTESSMSLSDDFFSTSSSSSSKAKTFKQAMDMILDKGPEFGVHVIMQLEKPTNFLFDDYVSPKRVFQKFKHLVMLRSDESVAASLHLNDTIRLETLSSDEERLRAYYYAEESDTYTMFTPYVTMDINEIEKFIENK